MRVSIAEFDSEAYSFICGEILCPVHANVCAGLFFPASGGLNCQDLRESGFVAAGLVSHSMQKAFSLNGGV
jgi:hypothetical protein